MSQETKKIKKDNQKLKNIVLWAATGIIVVQAIFGAGLYVGTQATINAQAETAKVKAQAVEEYKATLKN